MVIIIIHYPPESMSKSKSVVIIILPSRDFYFMESCPMDNNVHPSFCNYTLTNHEQQTTISFRGCPAFLRRAKINDFLTKQFPHQPPRAPSLVKCPPFMLFDHSKESSIFAKRKSHVLAAILSEESSVRNPQ